MVERLQQQDTGALHRTKKEKKKLNLIGEHWKNTIPVINH